MIVRSLGVSLANVCVRLNWRAGNSCRYDAYDRVGSADRHHCGMARRHPDHSGVRHRDHHVEGGTFIDEEIRDAD